FVSHTTERVSPGEVGTDIRPQEHKFWAMARTAFPDMEFRVDLLLEIDDLVVSHWTLTGTHTGGAYYDVPPSGERVTINGTAILRLRDGLVVEHWGGPHCMHGIGLLRTVGPGPHVRATSCRLRRAVVPGAGLIEASEVGREPRLEVSKVTTIGSRPQDLGERGRAGERLPIEVVSIVDVLAPELCLAAEDMGRLGGAQIGRRIEAVDLGDVSGKGYHDASVRAERAVEDRLLSGRERPLRVVEVRAIERGHDDVVAGRDRIMARGRAQPGHHHHVRRQLRRQRVVPHDRPPTG